MWLNIRSKMLLSNLIHTNHCFC